MSAARRIHGPVAPVGNRRANEKARLLIASSAAEAEAFARQRIAEIDAEIARLDDFIAQYQDNIAIAMDRRDADQARDRELIAEWQRVSEEAALWRSRRDAARKDLDDWNRLISDWTRRADELDGAIEEMAGKLETAEAEMVALEAEADRLGAEIADARGLDTYLVDATKQPELDLVIDRIGYLRDTLIPTLIAARDGFVRERQEAASNIEAYAAEAAALEPILAEEFTLDPRATLRETRDERDRIGAALEQIEAYITDGQAAIATARDEIAVLDAERADLQLIIEAGA